MVDSPAKRPSRDQKLAKQHELFTIVQREQDVLRQKIREKTERLRALRLARDAELEKQEREQAEARPKKRAKKPAT